MVGAIGVHASRVPNRSAADRTARGHRVSHAAEPLDRLEARARSRHLRSRLGRCRILPRAERRRAGSRRHGRRNFRARDPGRNRARATCRTSARARLFLAAAVEIFGEVAEDHLVERLLADGAVTEDGAGSRSRGIRELRRRSLGRRHDARYGRRPAFALSRGARRACGFRQALESGHVEIERRRPRAAGRRARRPRRFGFEISRRRLRAIGARTARSRASRGLGSGSRQGRDGRHRDDGHGRCRQRRGFASGRPRGCGRWLRQRTERFLELDVELTAAERREHRTVLFLHQPANDGGDVCPSRRARRSRCAPS